MSKTVSLYAPHLISEHHSLSVTSYNYNPKKHYNNFYDEKNCVFNSGNIFVNEFFAAKKKSHLPFPLVRDFFDTMFYKPNANPRYRPLEARENSHLLATLSRCITEEKAMAHCFKMSRDSVESHFEDIVNFVAKTTGFELRETYICIDKLSLAEEDKWPLSDHRRSEASKEKTVSAIPFIHHMAKLSDSKDLERAKRERRIAFKKFLFKARDIQQALRVVDEKGATLADAALINDNYDVYVMLKEEHKKLGMAPPALNRFLKAKNFLEAKEDEQQLFLANLMQDPDLLDACLLLPECTELLNIRFAKNGLTLLEWAVITKNYRMTASIFNVDPSRIRQAFAMASIASIQALYRDSLKYTRTDDEDLRVLLQCYATGRPDVISDRDKQISHVFELIYSGKINRAGLGIILKNNKDFAKELENYIQCLPSEIRNFVMRKSLIDQSYDKNMLAALWFDSKWTPKITRLTSEEIVENNIKDSINKSRIDALPPPKLSVMEIKPGEQPIYPKDSELWDKIFLGEIKSIHPYLEDKRLLEVQETELKFAVFLSAHPQKLKNIAKELNTNLTEPAKRLCRIINYSLDLKNQDTIILDLLTAITHKEIDVKSLIALPNIASLRKKFISYINGLKNSRKSYAIIRTALTVNHPLYELLTTDDSTYRSLIDTKGSLDNILLSEAKDIFIKFFRNSLYFPDQIEGAQPTEDSGTSLIAHSLEYLGYQVEGQELILSSFASYIFGAGKLTPHINPDQLEQLEKIPTIIEQWDPKSKYGVFVIAKREDYLKALKDSNTLVQTNSLLSRILICNQALEILKLGEAVNPKLYEAWSRSFPKNVFNSFGDFNRVINDLVHLRGNKNSPLLKLEAKVEHRPPPLNPELREEVKEIFLPPDVKGDQPPSENPYLKDYGPEVEEIFLLPDAKDDQPPPSENPYLKDSSNEGQPDIGEPEIQIEQDEGQPEGEPEIRRELEDQPGEPEIPWELEGQTPEENSENDSRPEEQEWKHNPHPSNSVDFPNFEPGGNSFVSLKDSIGKIDSEAEMVTFPVVIPGNGETLEIMMQITAAEFQKLKFAKEAGVTHFQTTTEPVFTGSASQFQPGNRYDLRFFPKASPASSEKEGQMSSSSMSPFPV